MQQALANLKDFARDCRYNLDASMTLSAGQQVYRAGLANLEFSFGSTRPKTILLSF